MSMVASLEIEFAPSRRWVDWFCRNAPQKPLTCLFIATSPAIDPSRKEWLHLTIRGPGPGILNSRRQGCVARPSGHHASAGRSASVHHKLCVGLAGKNFAQRPVDTANAVFDYVHLHLG